MLLVDRTWDGDRHIQDDTESSPAAIRLCADEPPVQIRLRRRQTLHWTEKKRASKTHADAHTQAHIRNHYSCQFMVVAPNINYALLTSRTARTAACPGFCVLKCDSSPWPNFNFIGTEMWDNSPKIVKNWNFSHNFVPGGEVLAWFKKSFSNTFTARNVLLSNLLISSCFPVQLYNSKRIVCVIQAWLLCVLAVGRRQVREPDIWKRSGLHRQVSTNFANAETVESWPWQAEATAQARDKRRPRHQQQQQRSWSKAAGLLGQCVSELGFGANFWRQKRLSAAGLTFVLAHSSLLS